MHGKKFKMRILLATVTLMLVAMASSYACSYELDIPPNVCDFPALTEEEVIIITSQEAVRTFNELTEIVGDGNNWTLSYLGSGKWQVILKADYYYGITEWYRFIVYEDSSSATFIGN